MNEDMLRDYLDWVRRNCAAQYEYNRERDRLDHEGEWALHALLAQRAGHYCLNALISSLPRDFVLPAWALQEIESLKDRLGILKRF